MEATGEQATRPSRVIDASVHIFFRSNDDLRDHMREPFKSRGVPDVEMDWYGAPGGEYVPWAERPGRYPGSDPDVRGRSSCSTSGAWTSRCCTR